MNFLKKRFSDVQEQKKRLRESSGIYSASQIIGRAGGRIELENCWIYFPADALAKDTMVIISMDDKRDDMPADFIPMTSLSKLAPQLELNKPATVRLSTWCTSKKVEINADLYHKECSRSVWKKVQPLKLSNETVVEFKISSFSRYISGLTTDKHGCNSDVDYRIQSCSFVDQKINKLTNHIIANNAQTKEDLKRDMRERGFKPTCSNDMDFTITVNDTIRVKLNATTQDVAFAPMEREMVLTTAFLTENGSQVLDFLLPEDCKPTVSFSHVVQLLRNGDTIDTKEHESDRVAIDMQSKPGMIVANTYNEGIMNTEISNSPTAINVDPK